MVFGTVLPVTSFATDTSEESTNQDVTTGQTEEDKKEQGKVVVPEEGKQDDKVDPFEITKDDTRVIFFQLRDETNRPVVDEEVEVTLQYRERTTADWTDSDLTTTVEYDKIEDLYKLSFEEGEKFEEGLYRATLKGYNLNTFGDDLALNFAIKRDATMVASASVEGKGTEESPFLLQAYVNRPKDNYNVILKGATKDIADKAVEIYKIKNVDNVTSEDLAKGNFEVTGNAIAELKTNAVGIAGVNYIIKDDGTITFGEEILQKGEFLAVKVGEEEEQELQVLNLWTVEGFEKFDAKTELFEAIRDEENAEKVVALEKAENVFDFSEEETITIRVKVETARFGEGRLPVVDSTIKISTPKSVETGAVLEVGEKVAEGKTNRNGYVEFTVAKEPEVDVIGETGDRDTKTVKYLITQEDTGTNVTAVKSDRIYMLKDGQLDNETGIYNLTIYNDNGLATRISGRDRYATALEIAKKAHPRAKEVIIASGLSTADALAAGPLAIELDAPILLTRQDKLSQEALDYLKEAEVDRVTIVGGEAVVSEEIAKELSTDYDVKRFKGTDRFETSVKIAQELVTNHNYVADTVILANGITQVDALPAARLAAVNKQAIVLARANTKDKALEDFFKIEKNEEPIKAVVIGGEAAIAKNLVEKEYGLNEIERYTGKDRYATSLDIAKRGLKSVQLDSVLLANGLTMVDALTAASLADTENGTIILVNNTVNFAETDAAEYIKENSIKNVFVIGGNGVISNSTVNYLNGR